MSELIQGLAKGSIVDNLRSSSVALYGRKTMNPQIRESTNQRINQSTNLKEAISEFESHFIFLLLKTMRQTSHIITGKKDDMHTFMMDQQLAWMLARHGGIGLSSALFNQLNGKVENESSEP